MSHLRLRCEFNNGSVIETTPIAFEPLSAEDLEKALINPQLPIELRFEGIDAVIDGKPVEGSHQVRTNISFPHSPAPYALVAGGWLPMPFAVPQRFLLDRNVLSKLRTIKSRGARPDESAFHWWTQIFEGVTSTYNPLLYAYEGNNRRTPTMAEFIQAYSEGVAQLKVIFPKSNVIEYQSLHYQVAYEQLLALQERASRDEKFLLKAVPIVVDRASRAREKGLQAAIIDIAKMESVNPGAPVVLAILSILYERVDGQRKSPGRRILKPNAHYSIADAYNAISDLRHIELAALSQAVVPEGAFSLCTNDRGIAVFWSALEVRGFATDGALLNMAYRLGPDLFHRLNIEEVAEVLRAVRSDA